jgi:MOSC domain-containing protein YiiM
VEARTVSTIEAICISSDKGVTKSPVVEAEFIVDWGISEDAHAGRWHRQVSILPQESIDRMRAELPGLSQGAFAENIITRGIDLASIKVGEMMQIGSDILLEITQLGKECHEACEIRETTGYCIMPIEGVFARVVRGGTASPGDPVYLGNDISLSVKEDQ